MNAPANVHTDESKAESAYRRSISIHCPNEGEFAMAARVDIAIIRDQATIGMGRASDSAAIILGEVSRLATAAVFAPVEASRLLRIRAALQLTMHAARLIERAQRNG